MIPPETVDLQSVGERRGIGKRLAGLGERPLSACVGKATARHDIECGDFDCEAAEGARKPEAVEDLSSVRRMRASVPVAIVATQSVRHRSPVAGETRCFWTRCEEVPESNAKQRHRSINREVNRTMVARPLSTKIIARGIASNEL